MTTPGTCDEPRTHVLIEHENLLVRETQQATLEAAGFEVSTCPGPTALEGRTCPLVADGFCTKALAADVIIDELSLGHLPVYMAHRRSHHDRPVLLGVSAKERVRFPILDAVATTVPRNLTGADLVDVVQAALDG